MSVEKVHENLMSEEGIKFNQLPENIQKKIKGFNLLYAKLEKQPDDEKLFNMVQKQSIDIADLIQNFIEEDFDDDDDDDDDDKKDDNKKDVNKNNNEPKKIDNSNSDKSNVNEPKVVKNTTSSNFGNLVMEKKILMLISKNEEGRITINDLKSIIGKEPDYPEQIVNNIKLRKVFLSASYRLV
jgi:hypothetical protein